MKVTYLAHSTILIEDQETKILCDPWLKGEPYYGSWAHYPPVEFNPSDYDDVDYIYISHIHPDHLNPPTLNALDADIPVYIHDFKWDFVKDNIERLGFDVTELSHGERHHLTGDLHLSIYASDDCNPEACQKLFSCSWFVEDSDRSSTDGSTHIDTIGVVDNGDDVIVNANDCRWPLSQGATHRVRENFEDIDCLLAQVGSAGIYPHAMLNLGHEEMLSERDRIVDEAIENCIGFVRTLAPEVVIPFASSIVFAGNRAERTQYHPTPALGEARERYLEKTGADPAFPEMIPLNQGGFYDTDEGEPSGDYNPIDQDAKWDYIRGELKTRPYTFESEPIPSLDKLDEKLTDAFEHFDAKRREIGFETDTLVYLPLVENTALQLPFDGSSYELVPDSEIGHSESRSVILQIDPRLISWILDGPHRAHYNNAEIGGHVLYDKDPDAYERGIYYCLNYLHT